jgi:dihydropteroate synthase
MLWKTTRQTLELPEFPLLMGVLNVTPDSFSDGGRWISPEEAIAHGRRMIREGARILDIGGESSRPGAMPVSESEELSRVLPVIEGLRDESEVLLSIDTMKPSVAAKTIEAGVSIVNDVSGLRSADMRRLVARTGAGAICMHMQGVPETMQLSPAYTDVVAEVREFFERTFQACLLEGVKAEQLMFDPGIGFGKTKRHNLLLLRDLSRLRAFGRPLALGVSRKSFLSSAAGCDGLEARVWPTVALSSYAFDQGISLLRIHDVAANAAAIHIRRAVRDASAQPVNSSESAA